MRLISWNHTQNYSLLRPTQAACFLHDLLLLTSLPRNVESLASQRLQFQELQIPVGVGEGKWAVGWRTKRDWCPGPWWGCGKRVQALGVCVNGGLNSENRHQEKPLEWRTRKAVKVGLGGHAQILDIAGSVALESIVGTTVEFVGEAGTMKLSWF